MYMHLKKNVHSFQMFVIAKMLLQRTTHTVYLNVQ